MLIKILLWLLMTSSMVRDIVSLPIQFPEDNAEERSIDSYGPSSSDAQPKFHHGLLQKHKKKKRKRKKLGCRISLVHRYKNAGGGGGGDGPEGRFFFYPLINYYDTDINIFNGIPGVKPGVLGGIGGGGGSVVDPCSSLIGAGAGAISGVGSIIGGIGGSGVKPPPSVITGGTQPETGGSSGGDNTDEDYDYSDGGDSDNNNNKPGQGLAGGSNLLSTGASTLGTVISNAPGAVSNVLSSISNGIRPFLQGPNRYFDYYVVRPFNRSLTQLVSWI